MKSITINGSKRESVGKKATQALRNAGQVPCVLYGGDKPVHFSAEELAFSKLVYTPNAHTVVIALGSETLNAVLQDIQFHPVTDAILHIDFIELIEGKPVEMSIPVFTEGVSRGVRNGGKQLQNVRRLRVKATPAHLPDSITINVEELRIGMSVRVNEIKADGFEFLEMPTAVVVGIRMSRGAADDDEEEEDEEE